jgi:hypothetical protein
MEHGHGHGHGHDHQHSEADDYEDDCCSDEGCCAHHSHDAHSHQHHSKQGEHDHDHSHVGEDDEDCCSDEGCTAHHSHGSHQHKHTVDLDHDHGHEHASSATKHQAIPTPGDSFTLSSYPDFNGYPEPVASKHTFRVTAGDGNRANSFSSMSDSGQTHAVLTETSVCNACDPHSPVPHNIQTTRLRIANLCCAGEERIIHNVLDGEGFADLLTVLQLCGY